jgi:hypothetical protein
MTSEQTRKDKEKLLEVLTKELTEGRYILYNRLEKNDSMMIRRTSKN